MDDKFEVPRSFKAIGIPAGLYRYVVMGRAMGVVADCGRQDREFPVVQIKVTIAQVASKVCGTCAMTRVPSIIAATGIVQESEILNDAGVGTILAGEHQAVDPDPCPVGHTMDTVPIKTILLPQQVDEHGRDDLGVLQLRRTIQLECFSTLCCR